MRILICRPNRFISEELIEYFRGCNWEADIADEPGSIYQSLSRADYDIAFYNVSSLDDFAVIRYINATHPETQVVITSDAGFEASIENVRLGAYTSLRLPNHLNQLQELLTANSASASAPGPRH